MRRLIGRLLTGWSGLWRRLEGPELEPPPWHSHFLSGHTSDGPHRALGARLTGRIIDIGAGTGHGARYLDPARTDYFPTDIPGARDAGDAGISRKAVPLAAECSVYDLPFEEGAFGGAMMLSVLEHLETPEVGLAEIFRVLEPGGRFLISTPFAFPLHGAPHDYRRWTEIGLAWELRRVGFEIEESRACGGAFAASMLNWTLAVRYGLLDQGRVATAVVLLLTPVLLVTQLIGNLIALTLDRLFPIRRFPIAIAVLARKPG